VQSVAGKAINYTLKRWVELTWMRTAPFASASIWNSS
jgi:hypothetical protein